MPKRSKIPEDVRVFIVERLAIFDTPQVVAEAVKAEFRLQITRQIIEKYDPTKVNGANVRAKFREHFFRIREKFRPDLDDIPIASKAVRLRRLDQMCETAMEAGAIREAADLLEQAAKDIPAAMIHFFETGHFALETHAKEIAAEIRDFFAR